MEQIVTTYYCELKERDIGSGLCCMLCKDIKRPKKDEIKHDHQICKYERITGTYKREI